MRPAIADDWFEANQRALMASLEPVRSALEEYVAGGEAPRRWFDRDRRKLTPTTAPAPGSVVERLERTFGLSPFERDVVLLCAGVELDARLAALCAEAHRDAGRTHATFGLALAALPGGHWSALAPDRPLRRRRLVELGPGGVTTASLRIDERVLHHLAGVDHLDERLAGLVTHVVAGRLTPTQREVADRVTRVWADTPEAAIHLVGDDPAGKRAVAAAACAVLSLDVYVLPAGLVPAQPEDLEAFVRLWEREAMLSERALLVDADEDEGDAARKAALSRLVDALAAPLFVTSREPRRRTQRPAVVEVVDKPAPDEQAALWRHALGDAAEQVGDTVDALVTQFRLSAPLVGASVAAAYARAGEDDDLGALLWDATRAQARPGLDGVAQRVLPSASWDDLVVPTEIGETLRDAVAQVRQRLRVYETWGFAEKGARGLGISALFSGPSGTGKTLAAEVVAHELGLDLYRVDLSQVVSKYIGETEKNLSRVFDAAEESGAVLLFDEADALFGKRSEVKDSHDRYANIEVGYLLQRMEAYRGLAVLTTNMKSALDPAFLRRLRFALAFPFPDEALRKEIWKRVFPLGVPLDGVDWTVLARLNVAGGNIRNIALHAAFLAADRGVPVTMDLLLRGARAEYTKLDKPLTGAEVAGWV